MSSAEVFLIPEHLRDENSKRCGTLVFKNPKSIVTFIYGVYKIGSIACPSRKHLMCFDGAEYEVDLDGRCVKDYIRMGRESDNYQLTDSEYGSFAQALLTYMR